MWKWQVNVAGSACRHLRLLKLSKYQQTTLLHLGNQLLSSPSSLSLRISAHIKMQSTKYDSDLRQKKYNCIYKTLFRNIECRRVRAVCPVPCRREAFLHEKPSRAERNLHQHKAEEEPSRLRLHCGWRRRAGWVSTNQKSGAGRACSRGWQDGDRCSTHPLSTGGTVFIQHTQSC